MTDIRPDELLRFLDQLEASLLTTEQRLLVLRRYVEEMGKALPTFRVEARDAYKQDAWEDATWD